MNDPQHVVDDEIRHIRDLVRLRTLLAERGATPEELRRYGTTIGAARRRLAEATKRALADQAAAA